MESWKRPEPPVYEPNEHYLIFQQIEIDHYNSFGRESVIRMYGVTIEGYSVCCHVTGFVPYFYVSTPPRFDAARKKTFQEILNKLVLNKLVSQEEQRVARFDKILNKLPKHVVQVDIVSRQSVYGYSPKGTKKKFLKISVALPSLIYECKEQLTANSDAFRIFGSHKYSFFESNINIITRFMVDCNVSGCSWIELPVGSWRFRRSRMTRCQIEVEVSFDNFISHAPKGEWGKIAPFRILSFDIECAGRPGVFPEAKIDRVIQIANIVTYLGAPKHFIKNIFLLDTCDPIDGADIYSFKREKDLLKKWTDFVQEVDPDIFTGYNINNFDFPYMIERAEFLNIDTFPYLGRIIKRKSVITTEFICSKQMGKRELKKINFDGRIPFDLIWVIQREHKLRSYTLNAVSYEFLRERKEDVHHSEISILQAGTPGNRRRVAMYCLKDATLPLRLLDKLMCLINYMEMARVTGTPLISIINGGQQIKIMSLLLRETIKKNYLIPTPEEKKVGEQFEGATVIEPKKGFYTDPIATLDFCSLYPSIMIHYNLCYTTLLNDENLNVEFIKTPIGPKFVTQAIQKGLLPEILETLLEQRKLVKLDLKNETDEQMRQVLDGRQLAYKICANSVYGFTGAQVGKLPCLEISSSVTAYGREMIEKTRDEVLNRYKVENGYKHDATVIYGDTDSVMIRFGNKDLAECMELGREAAKFVTSKFRDPIKLDFEKVYYPYLLVEKKRYAGRYYTRPDRYDKIDCKGMESVRRDNYPLLSNTFKVCLEKLLNNNPNDAMDFAKNVISDLLCNKIDLSQLITTKELTKTEYKNPQAHVSLMKKIMKRDPGNAPKLGDRIPYVICDGDTKKRAHLRAEDPIYALYNDIPLDTNYYLDHLLTSLCRIFEPIFGDRAGLMLKKGNHTLTKVKQTSKVGAMSKYVVIQPSCLGCGTRLSTAAALCKHCAVDGGKYFKVETEKYNQLSETFSQLREQCQKCQSSSYDEIICTNRDCNIFYKRTRVQLDLGKQAKVMERISW